MDQLHTLSSFVPVDTYAACRCRLLRCLNYNRASVPLEMRGDRWFLRQGVFRDWRDLETVILRLREVSQSAISDLRRGTRVLQLARSLTIWIREGTCRSSKADEDANEIQSGLHAGFGRDCFQRRATA